MVNCLVLYHSTITSLTKCKILRAMFHEHDFEINVIGNHTVIMYLWNIQGSEVSQVARSFETTNILVGHGVGDYIAEAEKSAWENLYAHTTSGHSVILEEKRNVYSIVN